MRTIAIIGLTAAGLSGCVVYEKDHKVDGYEEGYDNLDGDENPLEDDTIDDDVEEVPPIVLSFYPNQAEQGESFIGYITLEEGDMDLSLVQDVTFYGDVEVLDFDNRGDELIVSLDIMDDAITGPIDVLLGLGGNDVVWFEAAFTVYEMGSGHSCEDAEDPLDNETDDTQDDDPIDGGDGGDDGSGDGADDGSGDDCD